MRRDEAIDLLLRHRDQLAALGVQHISLFGSVARDEARADSDVDVLIELAPGPERFRRYLAIQDFLTAMFGRPVDVVESGAVKAWAREMVEREAVRVA